MPESVHFATRIKESLAFIRDPLADTEFRKAFRHMWMIQNVFDFSKKKTTLFLQTFPPDRFPIFIEKIVCRISNQSFGFFSLDHISDDAFFLGIFLKIRFEKIQGRGIVRTHSQKCGMPQEGPNVFDGKFYPFRPFQICANLFVLAFFLERISSGLGHSFDKRLPN